MTKTIAVDRVDCTAIIRLNRPEHLNAITTEMKRELISALDELEEAQVTAVILTGNGPGFCGGADLGELRAQRSDGSLPLDRLARVELTHRIIDRLRGGRFATIAAVNGVAAGGGISLALACDVVLAAPEVRFVWSFLDRGLVPDGGLPNHLRELLGSRRALSLLLRTSEVNASAALELGLVDEMVVERELMPRATEVAARLCDIGGSTVALLKRSLAPDISLGRVSEALAQGWALTEVNTTR